jgi:parallel beta-helix repeat protein
MRLKAHHLAWTAIVSGTIALAAPSGGPYGPIATTYAVPKAPHVFYVAPDGKAEAAGTLAAPTSIETAIAKATTGDAVILRGGVYRTGGLYFNQKIVLQPYKNERPVLKGTEIASGWQPAGPGVWKTSWTKLFPATPMAWWRREKEEAATPIHRFNNDMVFVDGVFLQSAGSVAEVKPDTFYVDYAAKEIYVGVDPAAHTVEITAHDGALIRTSQPVNGKVNDHQGPVIRGLTITGYARRCLEVEGKKQFGPNDEPTDEPVGKADASTYGKEAIGTVIENNTITYCSRVGGWFRGDNMVIRNNLVSDTSTEGIYVIGSSNALLERNVIRRNNIEKLTGYYPAAVKIFNQTHNTVFRDNLILENPNSNAIWFDVGNHDAVFVNNYIEGAQVGFFFEISNGATVAGNVFAHNAKGSWVLNSRDVHVFNNTYIDSPAYFSRNERSNVGDHFAWHPTTGPDVGERQGHMFVNNMMVGSETFQGPMLTVEQAPVLCGKLTTSPMTQVDGNVYARPASVKGTLISWAPTGGTECTTKAADLAELKAVAPRAETKGRVIDAAARDVLQSPDVGRYAPKKPLKAAVATPADVAKKMGVKAAPNAGAFQAAK